MKKILFIGLLLFILSAIPACSPGASPTVSSSINNTFSSPSTTVSSALPAISPSTSPPPSVPAEMSLDSIIGYIEKKMPEAFTDIPEDEIEKDFSVLYNDKNTMHMEIKGRIDSLGNEYIVYRGVVFHSDILQAETSKSVDETAKTQGKVYKVDFGGNFGIICIAVNDATLQNIYSRFDSAKMGAVGING